MAQEQQTGKRNRAYLSIRWKMIIAFLLVFIAIFAAVHLAFYFWVAVPNARAELDRELETIAAYAAAGIDGDAHKALYEDASVADGPFAYVPDESGEYVLNTDAARQEPYFGVDDPRYHEIVDWLDEVRESRGQISISDGSGGTSQVWRIALYTYVKADNPDDVVDFVATSEDPAREPSVDGAGFREPYPVASPELQNGLEQANVAPEPFPDVWGEWYSAFAPIYDSQGKAVGAVGVDMRVTIFKELGQRILNSILISFPISLAVMSLLVIGISVNISRPIIQLTDSAELVAQGKYEEAIAPEHDPLIRDETYTLSTVFELMVDKVREREQKLKQRVQELEIMIDEGKKVAQVQEIVESEFFKDLKDKAREMRGRAKKQATGVKKKARASAEK